MTEIARIRFYNIDRCGYYFPRSSRLDFSSPTDSFKNLHNWVHGPHLTFGTSRTFQPDEDDDSQPTYCFDLVHNKSVDDFLLVTWNEVPTADGNIPSVPASDKIGHVGVEFSPVPKNAIPGFASYFWIVPQHNLYATLVFESRSNGRTNMEKYVEGYLTKFSPHVVIDKDDEENHSVLGYRKTPRDPYKDLNPMFRSSPIRKPGPIQFLRENRSSIRRIVRKNRLETQYSDESTLLGHLLHFAGIGEPSSLHAYHDVRMDMRYTPSEDELNAIIREWFEDWPQSTWNDVGFILKGEQTPHWLSHSLASDKVELKVKRQNEEAIDPSDLLRKLVIKRDPLLLIAQEQ